MTDLALMVPGWRGGGRGKGRGRGVGWSVGALGGMAREREREGGVAGGEGSVEGVEVPDPVPEVAIVPSADKELLMLPNDGVRVPEGMSKEG